MKFCNRCGNQLAKKNPTHYKCTNCKTDHYANPKGAVAVLLFTQNGTLLLAKRAREPKKGMLDPIGGFLDHKENFEQALYRELQEETSLTKTDISNLKYLGSVHDDYPWQGKIESIVSCYFTATLTPSATPHPSDDVASFVEYMLSDIPDDLLAWQGLREMLELLKKR